VHGRLSVSDVGDVGVDLPFIVGVRRPCASGGNEERVVFLPNVVA